MKGQRQTSGKSDEGFSSGTGDENSGTLTNAIKAFQTNQSFIEEQALSGGPFTVWKVFTNKQREFVSRAL